MIPSAYLRCTCELVQISIKTERRDVFFPLKYICSKHFFLFWNYLSSSSSSLYVVFIVEILLRTTYNILYTNARVHYVRATHTKDFRLFIRPEIATIWISIRRLRVTHSCVWVHNMCECVRRKIVEALNPCACTYLPAYTYLYGYTVLSQHPRQEENPIVP